MFATGVWLLVLNGQLWLLPLSGVLYPDRIVLLLVIPLAIGLATVVDAALTSARRMAVWGIVVVTLGVAAAQSERYFGQTSSLQSRVTPDDLQAMRWIRQQTEAGASFRNRWEDAGLWIPCLGLRAVTNPHRARSISTSFATVHERCTPVTCTCRKPQDPRVGHSKASSGGLRSTEKSSTWVRLGSSRSWRASTSAPGWKR